MSGPPGPERGRAAAARFPRSRGAPLPVTAFAHPGRGRRAALPAAPLPAAAVIRGGAGRPGTGTSSTSGAGGRQRN